MANDGTFSRTQKFREWTLTHHWMMQTPVERIGWRTEDAEFVVVKEGLKPFIG